jgi:TolB-like protein/DNA-binding winged helix-turn-helix (wHTH) protein/Flp pilus assembly protein TadD
MHGGSFGGQKRSSRILLKSGNLLTEEQPLESQRNEVIPGAVNQADEDQQAVFALAHFGVLDSRESEWVLTKTTQSAPPKRFDAFEFDSRARQLRKHGHTIRLHGQPLEILGLLLERPAEVVLREELRAKLWPEDTFVDFEHSLNAAVNKLREALGDDANSPRFIETVPRRGYRFIAPVEGELPASAPDSTNQDAPAANQEGMDLMAEEPAAGVRALAGTRTQWRRGWLVFLACASLVALFVSFNGGGLLRRFWGDADPGAIRSLAVLPLENLSRDPEQEYFADGMTEALTTELAQISALKVISRTSVMQYKGTKKLLPQIAHELGVDAVVEGAVQRSGDKVEITVQLIHAPTDRHLLAKSYERGLSDILALQREIARAIADEIKAKLTPQEQARLTTARPVNPDAHDAYLKGLYYYGAGHDEADPHKYDQLLKSSIAHFSQATQMDPNYAPAYAGMAVAYAWQAGSDRKFNLKAREAAAKALQIDDTLGEAHYLLGWVAYYNDWNWSGAEKEFRRAIELNPSFGEAHYGYALYLNAAGRHDEAIAEIQRAQEVDPIVFIQKVDAGSIYACAGQYDRAIKQLRDAPDLKPNDSHVHGVLGDIYLHKGMQAESAAEYRKAAQLIGGNPSGRLALAAADIAVGNRTEASAILSDLANLPYQYIDWPVHLARQYASLGQKNLAMAWLEKAYTEHSYALLDIRCMREFDVLHSDPRFQDLLRRMKFPQ